MKIVQPKIPRWLKNQAEEWIRHPQVESVLLFGSRVTGHAGKYSDWDVAVIHSGEQTFRLDRNPDTWKQPVDLSILSMNEIANQLHLVGSLPFELAHGSTVVVGADLPVAKESERMSEEILARHLEYGFKELALAVSEIQIQWDLEEYHDPLEEIWEVMPVDVVEMAQKGWLNLFVFIWA